MAADTFRLAAVSITADVQPFGGAGSGEPDSATVSTTYTLFDPADAEEFGRSIDGRAASGLVSTTAEVSTAETEGGYALRLVVPEAGVLVKGAQFSAAVSLPPPIVFADGTALLPVLRSYTTDPAPQVFDGLTLPTLGGRTTVVWMGYEDPTVDLEYWYRKVRDTGS